MVEEHFYTSFFWEEEHFILFSAIFFGGAFLYCFPQHREPFLYYVLPYQLREHFYTISYRFFWGNDLPPPHTCSHEEHFYTLFLSARNMLILFSIMCVMGNTFPECTSSKRCLPQLLEQRWLLKHSKCIQDCEAPGKHPDASLAIWCRHTLFPFRQKGVRLSISVAILAKLCRHT